MKIINLALITAIVAASTNAFAGQDRGGGDMCENRIKQVRDDIQTWIHNKGPQGLDLPPNISVEQYSQKMLSQIALAKIRCVGPGDAGYPIAVDKTPKFCRFDLSSVKSQITCDYRKLTSLSEAQQYVLIHHEFAGLAGLEKPKGSDSSYALSNQISGYLVSEVVQKLAVKASFNPRPSRLSGFTIPLARCNPPGAVAKKLFQIVLDPSQSRASVDAYLAQNVVALDGTNEFCETPLEAAIRSGKTDVYLDLYQKAGSPDVNLTDEPTMFEGDSLYRHALRTGSLPMIALVEKQGGTMDNTGYPPLIMAASNNSVDVVRKLLAADPKSLNDQFNADPYHRIGQHVDMDDRRTALIVAAQTNSLDVVQDLVAAGADLNLPSTDGTAVAHAAARTDADGYRIVQLLISKGARVNATLALIHASQKSTWMMMRLLLQSGAPVNAIDRNSHSALFYASSRDDVSDEMVLGLLGAGADPNAGVICGFQCNPVLRALAGNVHSTYTQIKAVICAGGLDYPDEPAGIESYQLAASLHRPQNIVNLLSALDRGTLQKSFCQN